MQCTMTSPGVNMEGTVFRTSRTFNCSKQNLHLR